MNPVLASPIPSSICARSAAALLAACGPFAAAMPLAPTAFAAQPEDNPQPPAAQSRPAYPAITGKDFAGLRIAGPVQQGDITLAAAVAHAWTEQPEIPADRPQTTSRMLLTGDVSVTLGLHRFDSARALVWAEQIGVSEKDPSVPVYQVAIYFDRVGDPVAQAGVTQSGDRLLVTGTLAGKLVLRADVMRRSRPTDPFVREGEERLARLLRDAGGRGSEPIPGGTATPIARRPAYEGIRPGISRPYEPESPLASTEPTLPDASNLPPARRLEPIFATGGVFTFAGGDPVLVTGEEDNALIITGSVAVQYTDTSRGQSLLISAERVVVFLAPGPLLQMARFDRDQVRGIYLEGDVVATSMDAQRGQYTLRSPRIYYDVQNNVAVAVDAVFWTYDEKRGLPLYVRAKALRQEAGRRVTATDAILSTTSFFDPMFSLGASSITITRDQRAGQRPRVLLEANDLLLNAGPVPFFYWPYFEGEVENIPLRKLAITGGGSGGAGLKTAWDVFGLLGTDAPEGLRAHLLADPYFRGSVGTGLDLAWDSGQASGGLLAYTLLNDNGTDRLPSGSKIGHDGDTRVLLLGDHRWSLDENWSLFIEGSHVSDETFIPAYFRDAAETRREFTNAIYLRRLEDDSALTFIAKGEFDDFTPNEYLLQSQGYNVDKLPELTYHRLADDLLASVSPGLLSYSSEYRLSRMTLNFTEPTASELGFDTVQRSTRALGILPNQSPGDRLRAAGFSEHEVYRADTRQELALTLDAGPIKFTPFLVGRLTGYDNDFSEYSPDSTEQLRTWGAAGVRATTSIFRVDDSVDSELFDLHRIRHVLEPSVTAWTSGTNLEQTDLPVYDDEVESIASGSAVRLGLASTWQTQRGGEGRWRTVDVLKVSADFTTSSGDADTESPIGRFYDFRPEYSLLGDFATFNAIWQTTDSVAVTFRDVYDFDVNQPAYTVGGIQFEHSPLLRSYLECRYINARDTTLLGFGTEYDLTRKYRISTDLAYDTDQNDLQSINFTVRRRFPAVTLGTSVTYNNISSETTIGIVLEPMGFETRGSRLDRSTLSR